MTTSSRPARVAAAFAVPLCLAPAVALAGNPGMDGGHTWTGNGGTPPRHQTAGHAAPGARLPVIHPDTGVDPNMPIVRPPMAGRGNVIRPPASGSGDGSGPDAR